MTSNEFYGMLNDRFNVRAKQLRDLGYVYVDLIPGVAGFQRTKFGKTHSIPSAALHHAEQRAWDDMYIGVEK